MARIDWDQTGERFFEAGVDHCVLYLMAVKDTLNRPYAQGVPWNGITQISESPEGAEPNDFWADNMKYGSLRSAETFGATIEAYTYPDEFAECDGSAVPANGITIGQQIRSKFGLCYRTTVGNDETDLLGYKLHFVYGCTASPSAKDYATINDSPEAITFSWEMDTVPVNVTKAGDTAKPTSTLVIDTTKFKNQDETDALAALEDIIYGKNPTTVGGTDGVAPRLPLPDEIIDMFTFDDEEEEDEEGENA